MLTDGESRFLVSRRGNPRVLGGAAEEATEGPDQDVMVEAEPEPILVLTTEVAEELGGGLGGCDEQKVAGSSAGDIEQMAFGVSVG